MKQRWKLVGIGDFFVSGADIIRGFRKLEPYGVEVTAVDWDTGGPDELQRINLLEEQSGSEAYEPPQYILDAVADADIVVTQFCPVTKRVIDNCNALKIVGVLRAGIENVNESYLTEKNILFFHTPGRNATAVADFAVGMLLSECRNIARAHMEMKEGRWTKEFTNAGRVPDLSGKVAGVVGFGSIGRMVAKRLSAFDMEIVAYDPFVSQESAGTAARMVSLPELMSSADFITIHARLTDDTYHMINRELISMMKPTAYIINTARSGLTDEQALYEALRDNKITGAALDVFDVEPPGKDYKLVRLPNVTVTPHLAGGTADAWTGSPRLLAIEMGKFFETGSSRFLLNGGFVSGNIFQK
jgi:D-3-phosphoglycerate dehydrogenase